MVDQFKSWFQDNHTLVVFLGAQLVAMGAAAAAIIAYSVKLETRVSIMETRGAEYTVARMAKVDERITILEQKINQNEASIRRLIDEYLKK
jgi:hypothetical protein